MNRVEGPAPLTAADADEAHQAVRHELNRALAEQCRIRQLLASKQSIDPVSGQNLLTAKAAINADIHDIEKRLQQASRDRQLAHQRDERTSH
ncbi:hypothetical protein B7Y94_02130 [Candidatus Saccharibacteria bacterium 32-49-12]|nr:MAG: hypothetical protein B7Y94_02130 [Candidatus Saccharibacteria bacterium 32-49-12]